MTVFEAAYLVLVVFFFSSFGISLYLVDQWCNSPGAGSAASRSEPSPGPVLAALADVRPA